MMKMGKIGILKITGSPGCGRGNDRDGRDASGRAERGLCRKRHRPNQLVAARAGYLPGHLAGYGGAHANILHLLTAGVATGTAGPTSASPTIASVSATLTTVATLAATTVSSSCTFNTTTGAVSGTATLADGTVTVARLPVIHLADHPARNTTVSVPGVATITLNKHSTATDGTLTVTAIYVSLLGSTQTLSLGVSVCNAADLAPVPMMPSKAMPFALSGLGVLLIAGVSYGVARRNRFAPAA